MDYCHVLLALVAAGALLVKKYTGLVFSQSTASEPHHIENAAARLVFYQRK